MSGWRITVTPAGMIPASWPSSSQIDEHGRYYRLTRYRQDADRYLNDVSSTPGMHGLISPGTVMPPSSMGLSPPKKTLRELIVEEMVSSEVSVNMEEVNPGARAASRESFAKFDDEELLALYKQHIAYDGRFTG